MTTLISLDFALVGKRYGRKRILVEDLSYASMTVSEESSRWGALLTSIRRH